MNYEIHTTGSSYDFHQAMSSATWISETSNQFHSFSYVTNIHLLKLIGSLLDQNLGIFPTKNDRKIAMQFRNDTNEENRMIYI